MSTVTNNEAAERLLDSWASMFLTRAEKREYLDAALAAERRAMVERIRAHGFTVTLRDDVDWLRLDDLYHVLDEEAAR